MLYYNKYLNCQISSDLWSVKNYLSQFRCKDRIYIPDTEINELTKFFQTKMRLSLKFNNTPLSVMETITLALYIVVPKQKEIANIMVTSTGTIKSYFHRVYIKLGANQRYEAIDKAINLGIISIIH